ncbi:allantoin racemase [Litoreibacter meonggei]|uniref:Allantoin racemase n=1 Tax=Litoreibacter meonggei TaxID=1049199 RepID=A0A497V6P8_9RHOB|nr:aspartate/glutamate racemase family protein [Litoreibacter meonggei]RLJ36195.1 allantoin racemase [Litoreibacter meonggei]
MSLHIRVVTPIIPTGLTQASDFEGILGPEDRLSYVEIGKGAASIETELDEILSAPDTVAKIIEAEAEGVDAVVIDCMGDPGLRPARECVEIPVLGPCETTMNLACILGHRYSVLAVAANMRVRFENQARIYGAWDKYASTRSVDVPVLELDCESDLLKEKLFEQAILALENDGADTLIIGCTGMVGLAQSLQEKLRDAGWFVPVIDPIPITVKIAKALVETGISHSKAAYPNPEKKLKSGRGYPEFESFLK